MLRLEFKHRLKVGIFVFVALFILAILIIKIGNVKFLFTKKGYEIFGYFDSIAGLEKNASVRIAGVKVGIVKRIRLKNGKAEVLMVIEPGIKIPKDSQAVVATMGLMGEKYIEIFSGNERVFLEHGGTINVTKSLSLYQIGSMLYSIGEDLKSLTQQMQEIFGEGETGYRISSLIENMERTSRKIDESDIPGTFKKADETFDKMGHNLEEISVKINKLTATLQAITNENRGAIKDNLKKINNLIREAENSLKLLNDTLEKIKKGEGTVGKLINEPQIFEKIDNNLKKVKAPLNTFSKMRFKGGLGGYYLNSDESVKGYLDFYLFYDKKSLFQAQIVKDPLDSRFKLSAITGYRLNKFWIKGGIIESEFGIGVDYLLKEKFRISVDAYNFNRKDSPLFRLFLKYSFYPNIYILAGLNDFTLSKNREFLFGLGIELK